MTLRARQSFVAVLVLLALIWHVPRTGAADESVTNLQFQRLSEVAIEGPAERALIERVGAMIPRLIDPGGNAASVRVSGTVRSTRTGDSYRIHFPAAVIWANNRPELHFGDISLTVTPRPGKILDFDWPLPNGLLPAREDDRPLLIESGSVAGLFDEAAGRAKRLAVSVRNATYSESTGPDPDVAVDRIELSYAQSEDGAWSGSLDLAVSHINLAAIMGGGSEGGGAPDGPQFRIGPFSLHAEGEALDIAVWQAAMAGESPPDRGGRADLGTLSLTAEASDILVHQPDGSRFAADHAEARASVDFSRDPGRIGAEIRLDGTSWGEIPALPLLADILPTFVDGEMALESIPTMKMLELTAQQSARAAELSAHADAQRRYYEEAPPDYLDAAPPPEPEPAAPEPDPMHALNEAGTVLRLSHLTLGRDDLQLDAEGAFRFAPAGAGAPVFGAINYQIEKLGDFVGDIFRRSAAMEPSPGTTMMLVLLILLQGFGESPDGEPSPDGSYSYTYEILETGEFRINGIPFDPNRLGQPGR
jgi:hypothetical protein